MLVNNVCGVKEARMEGRRESERRASSIDLLLLLLGAGEVVTIIKVPELALINSTRDINIDKAPVAQFTLVPNDIFCSFSMFFLSNTLRGVTY